MWVTNRKHAYKVIKKLKVRPEVKLVNHVGCVFTTTIVRLEENKYRFTQHKPSIAGKGGFQL
jgi:hypothetical protein